MNVEEIINTIADMRQTILQIDNSLYRHVGLSRTFLNNITTDNMKQDSEINNIFLDTDNLTIVDPSGEKYNSIRKGYCVKSLFESDLDNVTWIAKIGVFDIHKEENCDVGVSARILSEITINVILEKIGYDLYHIFSNGCYYTPSTKISNLPVKDQYNENHYIVKILINEQGVIPIDTPILNSPHICSKYIEDYQDFRYIYTFDDKTGEDILFMDYLETYHKPPDKVYFDNGTKKYLVPLFGLMRVLAVAILISDVDVIGSNGDNCGVIFHCCDTVVKAMVVKIDPGLSFKFEKYGINHGKDIQYSNDITCVIYWDKLSKHQQLEFLESITHVSNSINNEDAINYVFSRFDSMTSIKERTLIEKVNTDFVEYRKYVVDIYKEDLQIYKENRFTYLYETLKRLETGLPYMTVVEYYNYLMNYMKEDVNLHDLSHVLVMMGNILRRCLSLDLSLELYYITLRIYEYIYEEPNNNIMELYYLIGNIYERKNRYIESLKYYRKYLDISGTEDESSIFILNEIGNIYLRQNRYVDSLNSYTDSLEIHENIYGKDHISKVDILRNIADFYLKQDRYEKSLSYYSKILNIKLLHISEYNDDYVCVAFILNKIAEVYKNKGEYNNSLKCYEESLSLITTILGKYHHHIATVLNNIAVVYQYKHNYEKSLEYYLKALNIQLYNFGENHNYVAITLNNIASVYRLQGRYDMALEYYERSLNIHVDIFGENHNFVAVILNNIAIVNQHQRNYNTALEYYFRSLNIRINIFGREHNSVLMTMKDIVLVNMIIETLC